MQWPFNRPEKIEPAPASKPPREKTWSLTPADSLRRRAEIIADMAFLGIYGLEDRKKAAAFDIIQALEYYQSVDRSPSPPDSIEDGR